MIRRFNLTAKIEDLEYDWTRAGRTATFNRSPFIQPLVGVPNKGKTFFLSDTPYIMGIDVARPNSKDFSAFTHYGVHYRGPKFTIKEDPS